MLWVDEGAFIVKRPVWTIERGPLLPVVTVLSRVNCDPVKETPAAFVVVNVPA